MSRTKLLLLSLFSFIALAAFVYSFAFSFYSKIFFQFPAGGASFWKPYFFMAWMGIVPLVFIYLKPGPTLTRWRVILPVSMLALTGLAANFYLSFANRVHPYSYSIYVYDGILSSNLLFHSHVLKGSIQWLLNKVSPGVLIRADAGSPYLEFLPEWVFLLTTILFFWTVIELVSFLRQKVSANTTIFWGFSVLTLGFYIVRPLIDGGPLCPEFLSAIIIFIPFVFGRHIYLSKYFLVVLIAASFGIEYLNHNNYIEKPYSWVTRDVLMHLGFLTFLLHSSNYERSILTRTVIALTLLGATFYLNRNYYFWHEKRFLMQWAEEGHEIIFTSQWGGTYAGELIREDPPIKQYSYRAPQRISYWDLSRQNRTLSRMATFLVDEGDCKKDVSYTISGEIRTDDQAVFPKECSGGLFKGLQIERIDTLKGVTRWKYQGEVFGCLFGGQTYSLARRLSICEVRKFILLPREANAYWPYSD